MHGAYSLISSMKVFFLKGTDEGQPNSLGSHMESLDWRLWRSSVTYLGRLTSFMVMCSPN